jgi:hypothetical protein
MKSLTVGQQVRAKSDRILQFVDHEPLVLWKRDQVLTVGGIVQIQPGQLEALIDLEGGDWENVPFPIMSELFDLVPLPTC